MDRRPTSPLRLSVCIPAYGRPSRMLQTAVDSAVAQLPLESELLLLPTGPAAVRAAEEVSLPPAARVVASNAPMQMAANWNRCLANARGDLIHLLHDDDAVSPGFYEAILALAERHPYAGLYGTGYRPFDDDAPDPVGADAWYVTGDLAARFLLMEGQHCCGSMVLSKCAVADQGPFRELYAGLPDEEAYLRIAASGGLAFNPARLYRERAHRGQGRYGVWRTPGFATTYMRARTDGAAFFGDETVRLARDSSAARLISVAVSLALAGEPQVAAAVLDDLAGCHPSCSSWPSFRLARLGCQFRGLMRVMAGRRRLLASWSGLRGRRAVVSAG